MRHYLPIRSVASTLFVVALLFILSACEGVGQAPTYDGFSDAGAPGDGPSPSVSDRLAGEVGVKRIVYHVGPVDLPAGTSAQVMLEKPLNMRFQTDESLWVTGFSPRVVDANGGELSPKLLHHAIMSNMHEENPLCSDAGGGNPFFIATSLLTEVELPQGFGYAILPTDPIEASVVLANPTEESFIDVYFEVELIARPMNEFTQLRDVQPLLVELDPCGHGSMEVEPGAFVERKATYGVPDAGELVFAQGVLQDFGSAVELTTGSEVMPFWRAEAELDEGHAIEELLNDPFSDASGVALKENETLTVGIAYDNFSESWLKGASAGAMVYIAPRS